MLAKRRTAIHWAGAIPPGVASWFGDIETWNDLVEGAVVDNMQVVGSVEGEAATGAATETHTNGVTQ